MAMSGAGSLAFGTLGFVGRNTAGRASLLAANTIAKSRIGRTGIGRNLYSFANKGASTSFDFRQTGGAKKLEGAVGGLGTVRKSVQHGMHGIEEDKIKERVEYAKKIRQSDEEAENEKKLKANKDSLANSKANYEKARKADEDRLKQEVSDQTQVMAQNGAARGKDIASVQADLTQAITNNDQASVTKIQNQLNQMLASNAQAMAAEQAALDTRKKALQDHQSETKARVATYDNDIAHMDAQINGGTHTDLNGQSQSYAGVTLDAAKKQYANNLQSSVYSRIAHLPFPTELTPGGITGHADHEAGARVIREAGKSGTERAIADLQASLASSAPAAPAHSPAPAGGGDTHH